MTAGLDYDDVLIVPQYSEVSSREDVSLVVKYYCKHSRQVMIGVPIIASNMHGVGTCSMAEKLEEFGMYTALTKDINVNVLINPHTIHTVSPSTYNKDKFLLSPIILNLDVAHGNSKDFIAFITQVRIDFPHTTIIAGNVATPGGVERLVNAGADIVKVGIGPGSVCTTRIKTGVGVPQLTAILNCAATAHSMGAHSIADGGCQTPGDIAKAFVAGADFVMLGGMLAGHDEGEYREDMAIEFYGSAYHNDEDYKTAEGKSVLIYHKGPVENTIKDILGGLRSACTYTGSRNLLGLRQAELVKVNRTHNKMFG